MNIQRVTVGDRESQKGQRGHVCWFTGLSAAGKTTIASAFEASLYAEGFHTFLLDGDEVRAGLNCNLGFSAEERAENVRRIAEVAALMADAGLIVLVACISPFMHDRARARAIVGTDRFTEVFVDTPLPVCEQRDPKGLYRRARAGELKQMTGIDSAYEAPVAAELVLDGGKELSINLAALMSTKHLFHILPTSLR